MPQQPVPQVAIARTSTSFFFSGFVLNLQTLSAPVRAISRILPAELIPAAKTVHSYEALFAFLIVLVWHLTGAHLAPESFPMDSSIFTGKIRKVEMREVSIDELGLGAHVHLISLLDSDRSGKIYFAAEVERGLDARGARGVQQRVLDGKRHRGRRELREHRAVGELHEAMHDALRVHDGGALVGPRQPARQAPFPWLARTP